MERLWIWRIGFPFVRALALFLAPMRVAGIENVPRAGPYLMVANHISWKDPPWIAFALRLPIRYMTKQEAFALPLLGGLLVAIGCFPVRRGSSDRRAIITALRVLASGQVLGFFPEGHRSENAALLPAHSGAAMLAARSGVPVLPIGVVGTNSARLGRFWRRDIQITVGTPFTAAELGLADDRALADAIMGRIAVLLPPKMRGVYLDVDPVKEPPRQ